MTNVKFEWNAIKADGKKALVWYSDSKLLNFPEGTITIYAKDVLQNIPAIDGLTVQNDSEMQSDYFESDRVRVVPSNPWYPQVLEAMKNAKDHKARMIAKREAKANGIPCGNMRQLDKVMGW